MALDPSDGIAPGWRVVIDSEEPDGPVIVVDREELRAIRFLHYMPKVQDGVVFACFERALRFVPGVGYDYSSELEFDLAGWSTTFDDAAIWLGGKTPELFVREGGNSFAELFAAAVG